MESMRELPRTFLEALRVARGLVASPEVAAHWEGPSALAHFSVRGLAGHLVGQATGTVRALEKVAPTGVEPVTAIGFAMAVMGSAGWDDLTSPLHSGVRSFAERTAAGGHDALVGDLDRAIVRLEDLLEREPGDRLLEFVRIVMSLDEFVITRIWEVSIHGDDLAVSVGLAAPAFPAAVYTVAIDALVDVARARHGDLAVLRALARRERDPGAVLRIF
jgi:hypothetical protein